MSRLWAAIGIAATQLRHQWGRTLLGVFGVAVAVLATVTLLSLGASVLEVGSAGFTRIGGDLWVTTGTVSFAPGVAGGVEGGIVGAHELTADIEGQQSVQEARALGFQSVYVGADADNLDPIIGAGVTGGGDAFSTEAGRSFKTADSHYANGSYDGPMTGEVLIDRRAAAQFGFEVGDTIHVGGTLQAARNNEFEVIGLSNDIARYLGTPTVILQLGELQEVTGTTGTDPAVAILVETQSDTTPEAAKRDLQGTYDSYEVRTNDEQFEAVLQRQSTVIASAITVAVLAVVGGIALVSNIMGLFVYQQRRQLAALRAIGVSRRLLVGVVAVQALIVAAVGAALGLGISWPAVQLLDYTIEAVIGFGDIISLPAWTVAAGAGLALTTGLAGTFVATALVIRVSPLSHLNK